MSYHPTQDLQGWRLVERWSGWLISDKPVFKSWPVLVQIWHRSCLVKPQALLTTWCCTVGECYIMNVISWICEVYDIFNWVWFIELTVCFQVLKKCTMCLIGSKVFGGAWMWARNYRNTYHSPIISTSFYAWVSIWSLHLERAENFQPVYRRSNLHSINLVGYSNKACYGWQLRSYTICLQRISSWKCLL